MSDSCQALLYLSSSDAEGIRLTFPEIVNGLERAYRAKAQGKVIAKPKLSLDLGEGRMRFALPAALPPYSCFKCSGVTPDNHGRGLPHINGLVILSDFATGVPAAIVDGNWISAKRTAAIGVLAAKYLARADSAVVGFIGCGVQARSNLAALRTAFPLRSVIAYSQPRDTAEQFAREVETPDLRVTVADDPRRVVEASDIAVTSVPDSPALHPFLDAAWLRPGAFANLVDLGRSWQCATLERLDIVATDDREQSEDQAKLGRLPYSGRFDADLAQLVSGAVPARKDASQRTALIHPGAGLGDLAVAALLFERAREKNLGIKLPR
jgi:alanine dehydrogenase